MGGAFDSIRKSLHTSSCVRRQDLHAFLLDNYFLLTRDEENGKHVVVSRVSRTPAGRKTDILMFVTAYPPRLFGHLGR
jgi:hypothetical protein